MELALEDFDKNSLVFFFFFLLCVRTMQASSPLSHAWYLLVLLGIAQTMLSWSCYWHGYICVLCVVSLS